MNRIKSWKKEDFLTAVWIYTFFSTIFSGRDARQLSSDVDGGNASLGRGCTKGTMAVTWLQRTPWVQQDLLHSNLDVKM